MTTQDQITQVLKAFTSLANKFSTTSQVVFGWAVRNEIAIGIVYLTLFSIFALIGLSIFFWFKKKTFEEYDDTQIDIIIVLIVIGLICCFLFASGTEKLISPQYCALQSIISNIRGK